MYSVGYSDVTPTGCWRDLELASTTPARVNLLGACSTRWSGQFPLRGWLSKLGVQMLEFSSLPLQARFCISVIVKEGQTGLCKLLNHLETQTYCSAEAPWASFSTGIKWSCFASEVGPGLGNLACCSSWEPLENGLYVSVLLWAAFIFLSEVLLIL